MGAGHGIKAASGERQKGRISLYQTDVLESFRFLPVCCQHPPGKINPNHRAVRSDLLAQVRQEGAGARADIQNPFPFCDRHQFRKISPHCTLRIAGVEGNKSVVEAGENIVIASSETSHGAIAQFHKDDLNKESSLYFRVLFPGRK